MMTEQVLADRANALRDAADQMQERLIAENGRLEDPAPEDRRYLRGFADGYRCAADVVDPPVARAQLT